jgi:arabinofuranosyltransferase
MLTRLDSGLLLLPVLGDAARRVGWRRAMRPLLGGFLPLAAWHLFALVYYGTPFPNTAYAKMATGLTLGEYVRQGIAYLGESLTNDPVTLVTVALGLVLIVVARVPHRWTIAIGVLVHLAYVVRVGGDFMSGRFLTADFFWIVLALPQLRYPLPAWTVSLPMVLIALLARGGSAPPLATTAEFGTGPGRGIPPNGIVDERFYYYQATGLLRTDRIFHPPLSEEPQRVQRMLEQQRYVVPRDAVGLFGFHAGRRLHVVDVLGLGDPLLARLPTQRPWRIGHFYRRIPEGYEQSLATGRNVIEDANLRRYYDDLLLAIRGPLWSPERWGAIARLNLGTDDALLAASRRGLFSMWATSIPAAPPQGVQGDTPTVDIRRGLYVMLPAAVDVSRVEVSVDVATDYRLSALRRGQVVRSVLVPRDPRVSGPLSTRVLDLSADGRAIDAIEIVPRRGDPPYRLASLVVVPAASPGSAR